MIRRNNKVHPVPGHQQGGGHCNSQIEELSINTETSSKTEVMTKALEECGRQSDEYFRGAASVSPYIPSDLPPMQKLAHKCVSVQFLLEFNEKVVQPYRSAMTVKQVVEEIIIPTTKNKKCSFIDQLRPNMCVAPHAFVSHAFGNPFSIIVETLMSYFKDAVYSEVYVWIDIFIINQHNPGDDLHGGQTLKATIEASGAVVVCLDKNTLPLFRLWCLYEIGSTPIEKLVLLTHGFDAAELGLAYAKIDATTADCWAQSDREMIRRHIRTMMIDQKVVGSECTVEEALAAFTRVLKLLFILKPTSYAVDTTALLDRATGYDRYPLKETVEKACTGGRLICIAGGSGDGKSTLAAALMKTISIDACHFCKMADVRRQDRGLIIRSLSYQLAIRHPEFAQSILAMTPSQVESLSDEATAYKQLLETPLIAARCLRATILIDALDESGEDGRMISLLVDLDNVQGKNSFLSIIVTTRPEPALLSPLRSHWKGERYQEFTPSELRGEEQSHDNALSPLLRTLTASIQRAQPTQITPDPLDLDTAYGLIFDRSRLTQMQHHHVLEVLLASYEPQSLSDLKAMGILEMTRKLPGHGELFLERENKLHLLHRSIAEWLVEQGVVDVKKGHERIAAHIWETVLLPWLPSISSSLTSIQPTKNSSNHPQELPSGSYFLKYALNHLRDAARFEDIKAILFRLPVLQTMLTEKGFGALIKDILSLTAYPTLAAATKKLVAVLRLSSSALLGSDAWKCLPSQLLGRLKEAEEEIYFQHLREEANSFTAITWQKPFKNSLKAIGSLEMTMIGHKGRVGALCILPDGRIVSCSVDNTVRIWNSITGDCEKTFSSHHGGICTISILPDGRIVSGSEDKTVRIWNSVTGDCEMILLGHKGWVLALAIFLDGRIVSGATDLTIRIWNSITGDCEMILSGHGCSVDAILILNDGRIVSGSADETLRIWNGTTSNCEMVLSGHQKWVRALSILPDGRIVSCSADQTVRIWNSITGDCEMILSGHEGEVTALSVLPDSRIVSGSEDKTLRIWSSTTGDCEMIFSGHLDEVRALSTLSDGRVVSGSVDKTVRIWNWTIRDCKVILSGHQVEVCAISILPDGRVVTGSEDMTVRIWNSSSGDCEKILSGHKDAVKAISVLTDGRIVSGSDDLTLRFWDATTGDCEMIVSVSTTGFRKVIALSDGRFLSYDWNYDCLLWSPDKENKAGGFRNESITMGKFDRLQTSAEFTNGGVVCLVASGNEMLPGYSVYQNCVRSKSFGRIFVDEVVQWVVKIGDVIVVFERNGKDHWFREVSGDL